MSSPFAFNPDSVSSTIEVLDPDTYEVQVGEPKAFSRTKSDGSGTSVGIRYPLTVMEGANKGKKIFYTCYLTSEGAQSIAKQFLLAAYGFKRTRDGEQEFNAMTRGADWDYNVETGVCGEAWSNAKGKRVMVTVEVKTGPNGDIQQEFKPGCFVPYGS